MNFLISKIHMKDYFHAVGMDGPYKWLLRNIMNKPINFLMLCGFFLILLILGYTTDTPTLKWLSIIGLIFIFIFKFSLIF